MRRTLPSYDFNVTHPDYPEITLCVVVTSKPYPATRDDPGDPGDYAIVGWIREDGQERAVKAWLESEAVERVILDCLAYREEDPDPDDDFDAEYGADARFARY